jgi:heme iron utilization protein
MNAPWEARKLLRAARVGSLATAVNGQPSASLVTPACAPDLTILLLLSELAEHTRHLRADSRCSVLVTGTPETANPQTTPRVTVSGTAELADQALKPRYLALHPYAAQYIDFADFALWRIKPSSVLYVGGFARAARLRPDQLAPDPAAVTAIAAAEADIIADYNAEPVRVVAVDVDGCDLASGERVQRVHWSAPVATPADIGRELVRLMGSKSRR